MSLDERLEELFQSVFHDETLRLTDETTTDEIPGWDSVAHVNLMFSIEEAFGVQFSENGLAEFANIRELKAFLRDQHRHRALP
jgi:acyl carrier protein